MLALKAINEYSEKEKIENQTIVVNLNGQEQNVDIDKNILDVYEIEFDNVKTENHLSIEMKKGLISYEIIKEYYQDYGKAQENNSNTITVNQNITQECTVNGQIIQEINITNNSEQDIVNGLVKINIPQGCSVDEESLNSLVYSNFIEKFEYNYENINLYIRDFEEDESKNLKIVYRALYPEKVTAGAVKVYDYYNPDIEGMSAPNIITVSK